MKIVFTPDWFRGDDVLIEGFSFIILLVFFILSMRSYKLSKNKNSLYLGVGFLLIAVAELATILTKVVLFYDMTFTQYIGQMVVTYNMVKSVDIFYYIGFFWHKFLTLCGFFVIYRLSTRKKFSSEFWLVLYFLIISAVFSSMFYYLFHLTALVILALIITNYYEIYKINKSTNTRIFMFALCALALSQIIFLLSGMGCLYVAGQFIQLASYLILLLLIIRILKHGNKENKGI